MKIPAKMEGMPLNKQIFGSMFAISSAIILLISIATCSIIFTKVMDLETKSSIQNLDHINSQLDFFLTSVDNYTKSIIVNAAVQDATNKYNTKKQKFSELDQMRLKDELNTIIQSTSFIYGVNVYSQSKQLIASTEVPTNEDSLNGIEIPSDRIWLSARKTSISDRNQKIPVLMLVQRFYSYSTGKMLGYIEISIPETSISDIYRNTENENNTCIIDSTGSVQSTDGLYPMYSVYPNLDNALYKNKSGFYFINNKIIFYKYFQKLNWYIITQVSGSIFLQPIYFLIFLSVFIAACGVVICTILSHKIARTITSPIDQLILHIQKVIQGQWEPVPNHTEQNEIGFLFNRFNEMLVAQANLKDNLLKEQKMKQKLSLDLLQEQVNPHFLYNTLDNICSLAEINENETLIEVVMNLSKFYRETLSRGSFFVTIQDEISITTAYLNIMRIRYFNKFEFTISCPGYLKASPCLKLLLQPIVENSIYHGISQIYETGIIKIDIAESENGILFTVCDNGVGISEKRIQEIWEEQNSHFGLKNVDQRIKLYYGDQYGLKIKQNADKGCTITLEIAKEV